MACYLFDQAIILINAGLLFTVIFGINISDILIENKLDNSWNYIRNAVCKMTTILSKKQLV